MGSLLFINQYSINQLWNKTKNFSKTLTTQEIEHNGERFVPIERIGEVLGYKLEMPHVNGKVEYQWNVPNHDETHTYSYSIGWDPGRKSFAIWYYYINGEPIEYVGGYDEIQKLFEWKFDLFQLIPDNLAINLEDVK